MTHLLTAKGVERRPPIRASPLQTGHTVCRSLKRVALSFLVFGTGIMDRRPLGLGLSLGCGYLFLMNWLW
jgi:hypothetical protein